MENSTKNYTREKKTQKIEFILKYLFIKIKWLITGESTGAF
jgi:hypothetical protein